MPWDDGGTLSPPLCAADSQAWLFLASSSFFLAWTGLDAHKNQSRPLWPDLYFSGLVTLPNNAGSTHALGQPVSAIAACGKSSAMRSPPASTVSQCQRLHGLNTNLPYHPDCKFRAVAGGIRSDVTVNTDSEESNAFVWRGFCLPGRRSSRPWDTGRGESRAIPGGPQAGISRFCKICPARSRWLVNLRLVLE